MNPKLVTFCAYPVSGKTTFAKHLEEELQFARIGTDELLEDIVGKKVGYGGSSSEQVTEAWQRLCDSRDKYLSDGKSVVLDSTGTAYHERYRLLDTELKCEKYVIQISVRPGLHVRLFQERVPGEKMDKEMLARIKQLYELEPPKQNEGF